MAHGPFRRPGAWALLAGSVLWDLALSTTVLDGRARPNGMLDLHRFLGGLALVFTGVHVLALVLHGVDGQHR